MRGSYAAMVHVTTLMRMRLAATARQNIIRIRNNAANMEQERNAIKIKPAVTGQRERIAATQLNANPATAVAIVV